MDAKSTQLVLFKRAASLATLGRPYVPVLLAKRGERQALEHLGPATWSGLTPWIRIVPPELRSRQSDAPPADEMKRLAAVIGDRAIYLDPAGTPRRRRSAPALSARYAQEVFEAGDAAGLAFAPVYPFGRPDLGGVVAAAAHEVLGAAVLVTSASALTWGTADLESELRREIDTLGLAPTQLDLMIDIGYVAAHEEDDDSVLWLVRKAILVSTWRSVILCATCVPDSFAAEIPDDSLDGVPRRERDVFDRVQAQVDVRLRYGDYAVQHPIPPAPGNVPKMRASIRYTAGDYLFVSRGGRPVREMASDEVPTEYLRLASRLRDHPPFAGRDCCWGDERIEGIADGGIPVRTQQGMRAVATCHHLTTVATERAGAPSAPRSTRGSQRVPAVAARGTRERLPARGSTPSESVSRRD